VVNQNLAYTWRRFKLTVHLQRSDPANRCRMVERGRPSTRTHECSLSPESVNAIWLCGAVIVLGGVKAADRVADDSFRSLTFIRKDAGVAKPSVKPEGVKPGQRRRALVMRGGLRTLSRRGSGVRIPSPAPFHSHEQKQQLNSLIRAIKSPIFIGKLLAFRNSWLRSPSTLL
jgi:hypothetical protein